MHFSKLALLAAAFTRYAYADEDVPAHGEEESEEMGPIAFMWPEDREWSASADNTAPCGSRANVGNRTEFPLTRGAIALVAQDEAWTIQVAISYDNNPQSNDDFQTLISERIGEIDPGHVCYSVPEPSRDIVENGANATIQVRYTSDFGGEQNNETFYACSDITYVNPAQFTMQIPCFNVTSENFTEAQDPDQEGAAGLPYNSRVSAMTAGVVTAVVLFGSWLM